ncbi:hypothetical protein [Chryseobacterium sp. 18068]|nr:hypothetical protein [Chryseobacterium sp. 18068]
MLEKFEDFITDLKNNPTVSIREESVQENRELPRCAKSPDFEQY